MNRKTTLIAFAIAVVVLSTFAPVPAMADIATVNTTLDVNDILTSPGWTGGVQGAPPFAPSFSVNLSPGDTFDFTINFLPGQQLTINNLSFIWAFSYANAVANVTGTGALSLLDSTGTALYTSNTKTDTEGAVHFGQGFGGSEFPGLPTSVTFAGLHYLGTVDAYTNPDPTLYPDVTVRTYNDPALYFSAESFSTTSSVPEPFSLLLLGTAILFCGGTLKRKLSSPRSTNL